MDQSVLEQLDRPVSYICRYGDRFTKDCVCVQLYDDTDYLMRLAVEKGALVCVTDHKIRDLPCIVVPDPYEIYTKLCCFARKRAVARGTAVFGSIGKTTTKKMIYSVYKQGAKTWCDTGNDNILDSVGSICQHVPTSTAQVVVEMSEDTPGLIKRMSEIISPDICVVTDLDKSHIKFYGSEDAIIDEFNTAISCLAPDGVCITNGDNFNNRALSTDKKILFVSMKDPAADYYADSIMIDSRGMTFCIHEKSTCTSHQVRLYNCFATHNVYSALMAFAAGVQIGLSHPKIVKGLSKYRPSGFRQNIYRSGKTVIYADCYNAVAKSVRSAMLAADQIPVDGNKIAVLGDVAEAGTFTVTTHSEIVSIVNQSAFQILMTCGLELKKAIEVAELRDTLAVYTFETQKEMNQALKKQVSSGDLVLFKSSHSGNLQQTIRSVFPMAYFGQMLRYYGPRLLWHLRVLLH